MKTIIFSHANSFGASTYRILLDELRCRGFIVHAIEQFGHNSCYPVSNNWPYLVEELRHFAEPIIEQETDGVWFVGHSLGGFLSTLTASKYPNLARGVVLLDSPVLVGWRAQFLNAIKSSQLVHKLAPTSIARNRRMSWPSVTAALEHFEKKRMFAAWDRRVLLDYVTHGTIEKNGQRVLRFDRAIEAEIYSTLPDNTAAWLRAHPLQCPVSFVGGIQSKELKRVGLNYTRAMTKGRMSMLKGSHLFPMEKPIVTAAFIEACIVGMEQELADIKESV
jgi:pimeloyl-ACP methyl ester carboxylesterase